MQSLNFKELHNEKEYLELQSLITQTVIGDLEAVQLLHYAGESCRKKYLMNIASKHGHRHILQWLYNNCEICESECNQDALNFAVQNNQTKSIEWLISYRLNWDFKQSKFYGKYDSEAWKLIDNIIFHGGPAYDEIPNIEDNGGEIIDIAALDREIDDAFYQSDDEWK
jgi:hypothetical protein